MKIRSFSIRIIVFVLPLLLVIPTIYQAVLLEQNNPTQRIFHHRIEKLNEQEQLTTVLVGDSALGNGINDELFSQLTGEPTSNLALNGRYGYAGTYNMTRRALDHSPELKNVIIVHTLDMMQRNVSDEGYIRTVDFTSPYLNSWDEWREIPDLLLGTLFSPTGINAATTDRNQPDNRPIDVENDFIAQQGPLNPDVNQQRVTGFRSRNINVEKTRYLSDLAAFCVQHDLNCIYIHGPIWHEIASRSEQFVVDANQLIAQEGILLIEETVLLEADQIGDNPDHVATHAKDEITAVYAEIVLPYLE